MDPAIERRFLLGENEVKRLRAAIERKTPKRSVDIPEDAPFVCSDVDRDGHGHSKSHLGIFLSCRDAHVRERARQARQEQTEAEIAKRVRRKKIRQAVQNA